MTRRALLIGAETYGLTGTGHDVAAMTAALEARGFTDIRICAGPAATRDGIIAAYEDLIAAAAADDVALVYFSGHGGYARPLPGEAREVERSNRQFIVPTDFGETTDGDFRGITAVELSVLLRRLTDKTANAVVVLDCCHSALMSRDAGGMRVRQLPRTVLVDLEAHVQRRLGAGLRIDLASPRGNEHAVRVVACAADQQAYELPLADGTRNYGVLTDALVAALAEASDTRVSWSVLISRVRHLVQQAIPHQRPEAEGPTDRAVFELGTDDSAGWLPVVQEAHGRVRIDGAPLLGVQVGDEFTIMPASADGPSYHDRIATVLIDECTPTAARGAGAGLGIDARAFRTGAVAPRVAARLPKGSTILDRPSSFVRIAAPDEHAPIEVVESDDGALTLHDVIGPLHSPRRPGPETDRELAADLDRIARATALRCIREAAPPSGTGPVALEWGHVRGGTRQPLPLVGRTAAVGESIYLEVRNHIATDVYVSLLDIGVSYAVTLLTDHMPTGVRIPAGSGYVYGENAFTRQLTGVPLAWPPGLDRSAPRPETVLVLITSHPHDMGVLRQRGVRTRGQRGSLDNLLAHFGAGATRDIAQQSELCCARSFEWLLDPTGAPGSEA